MLSANESVLVTGGAGFIGSALVRHLVETEPGRVINVDLLTYAGNLESVADARRSPDYIFERADIADFERISDLLARHQPSVVFHLAAESHVDRSIDSAAAFIQTNFVGTFRLLEAVRQYWAGRPASARERFRFIHVSTDEVYGSLGSEGAFTETTAYHPNSPYSASKAGADHLARAWWHTYGLPTIVTNCSNNYGPYQFPEKLIPVVILKALRHEPIPVYGRGANVRDWLYVEDHVRALATVGTKGRPGETYNIGGNSERTNLQVVQTICGWLDRLVPNPPADGFASLITYVQDRPGHDFRYAIDATKLRQELAWQPAESFDSGIEKTVKWYLANSDWWQRVLSGEYRLERLGLKGEQE